MKSILITSLILLTFCSCEIELSPIGPQCEQNNVTKNGILREYLTMAPLPNVEICLRAQDDQRFCDITDSEGYYSVSATGPCFVKLLVASIDMPEGYDEFAYRDNGDLILYDGAELEIIISISDTSSVTSNSVTTSTIFDSTTNINSGNKNPYIVNSTIPTGVKTYLRFYNNRDGEELRTLFLSRDVEKHSIEISL